MQKPAAAGLVVVGESDYKILLVHKLCAPEKYTRQGGMHPSQPVPYIKPPYVTLCGACHSGMQEHALRNFMQRNTSVAFHAPVLFKLRAAEPSAPCTQ